MYTITDELFEEIGNAIIKWNALAVKIVLDKLLSEAHYIDIKDFDELKDTGYNGIYADGRISEGGSMKELARKGNIRIGKRADGIFYLNCYSTDDAFVFLNPSELSDLKDCISQVTAKKWKQKGDGYTLICPDCENTAPFNIAENFCPNCGIKLEGVEE